MATTFGAFRELYRNQGIYWAGTFNIEGHGEYRSLNDAKAAIDRHIEALKAVDAARQSAAVDSASLIAHKNADGSYTIVTPNGPMHCVSKNAVRSVVFSLEEKFDTSLVWA